MSNPVEYKYSAEHEWISPIVDGIVTLGITDHAQSELGDVVYVDLPSVGDTFSKEDSIAVVESVKAASDVYTPVSGEVVEVNEALDAEPGTVNSDATGAGWICTMRARFVVTAAHISELCRVVSSRLSSVADRLTLSSSSMRLIRLP